MSKLSTHIVDYLSGTPAVSVTPVLVAPREQFLRAAVGWLREDGMHTGHLPGEVLPRYGEAAVLPGHRLRSGVWATTWYLAFVSAVTGSFAAMISERFRSSTAATIGDGLLVAGAALLAVAFLLWWRARRFETAILVPEGIVRAAWLRLAVRAHRSAPADRDIVVVARHGFGTAALSAARSAGVRCLEPSPHGGFVAAVPHDRLRRSAR